jgi:hypothetical protein
MLAIGYAALFRASGCKKLCDDDTCEKMLGIKPGAANS